MKAKPTYKAGDDHLFQLFDTAEMEHVCGLLVGLADEREAMAAALRKQLGKPIAALLNRIIESGRGTNAAEWDALERFAGAVEATAARLSLSVPLGSDEAEELAQDLRAAWLEAIAYASAYRMYSDLPRDLETNKRKTAGLRESRKTAAEQARGDHGKIRTDYAQMTAAGERNIAKQLAKKYNRTEGDIRNIWSRRPKTKL